MPRTIRFEPETEQALKQVARDENISENAVINRAVREYAHKRTALRDELIRQIITEDKPLLDRLA
jgi:predicted transcriptional regulator